MQRRPFHLGELLVVEPDGTPEGAGKHIQVRLPEGGGAEALGHEEEHDEEAVVDAALLEERAAPRADERVLQHPHRGDGEVQRHRHHHPVGAACVDGSGIDAEARAAAGADRAAAEVGAVGLEPLQEAPELGVVVGRSGGGRRHGVRRYARAEAEQVPTSLKESVRER